MYDDDDDDYDRECDDDCGSRRCAVTRAQIERQIGARIRHGWILDGAGPARWGWAAIDPCRERWLGRSLAEVAERLSTPTLTLSDRVLG